jgi:dihydrofolate reductase
MPRPRIRVYVAVSLDGFVADTSGGVDWLQAYEAQDVGFGAFLAQVQTIVSGRRSYDLARGAGAWPGDGKRIVVLTHRPLEDDAPPDVETASGDVRAVAQRLKRESNGDIWILGGATVAQDFLEHGLVDRIELYIMPVLLGDGVRLFAPVDAMRVLGSSEARSLPNGIVGLTYELTPKLHAVRL